MAVSDTPNGHRPLSHKDMVFYGFPHLTHAIVALPMALFIPSYYADELALPMAQVGAALAASRLLDIFIDPLVGTLSDRCQTRWGRRKPWLACGTPLLMLAAWMIFVPIESASISYLMAWSFLLFFAYTLVDLPYKAWGAELSGDYAQRSRITAWREAFGFLGQVLFLTTLLVMGLFGYDAMRWQLLAIAVIMLLSQPLLVGLTLRHVPEWPAETSSATPVTGWRALQMLAHNRAFLRSLSAIVLFGVAVLMQATLHRFVLKHVVGEPELFAPMILAENLLSVACLPIWVLLSDRYGKHRAVSFAVLWMAFWSLFFPLVGPGDSVLYVTLILLRGCSLAAILFLATSIGADVVDYDTVISGQQRTGLYFSVWGMATKLAIGLGVLLGTSLPAHFGFDPTHAQHSAGALDGLLMIYGWFAAAVMLFGIPFLWNFPIDRERHQSLREQIISILDETEPPR